MSARYPLPSHKDHISVTLRCGTTLRNRNTGVYIFYTWIHPYFSSALSILYWKDLLRKKLYISLKHSIVLPVMDFRLGDLHLPTLGCSHKLHFKPCWDPVADLGLPRYTVTRVSISYFTKMSAKKGWWRHFPCHWAYWQLCSSGCQLRHDCSYFYSDVV